MKLPSSNTILLVIAVVLITLQISSLFRKTQVNEELIVAREKIKHIEEKRISDSINMDVFLKLKDENIALLKKQDAVIVNQYIQSNDKLKTITPAITNLDRENLRRTIERYSVLQD